MLCLVTVTLYAASSDTETKAIVALYQKGQYATACDKGMQHYFTHRKKEPHFVAMVGMACAKSDMINWLGVLQRYLVQSPPLRSTATYFTTLLLDKRLLYQHFVDGVPVEGFRIPLYDHILSTVMDRMSRGDYEKDGNGTVRMTTREGMIEIRITEDQPPKLMVFERNATDVVRSHWYR